MRAGGKLVLTDGISSVEGAAGGGITPWALIAGNETDAGIGGTVHATTVRLPDFDLEAAGVAVGVRDRVELSYTYQHFDTRDAGAALGLGKGFTFGQHIVGAKLRVAGDAVWDQDSWMPQVAVGAQYKIAEEAAVIHAVGGRHRAGTDFYASATKLFLAQGVLLNTTVRYTRANQLGLLGFGGDRRAHRSVQAEGSAAFMLSPSIVVGVEGRTKPSNLGFAQENDVLDGFAAVALGHHFTLTAAYADLGNIATVRNQRGLFLQLQAGL